MGCCNAVGWYPLAWGRAISLGVEAVSAYGGAKLWDRTLLDALIPAIDSFLIRVQAGDPIPDCMFWAAATTTGLVPQAGRSNYIDLRRVLGTPDLGAVAVARWIYSLSKMFAK